MKGAVDVKVKYGDQETNLTLTIVDGDGSALLGRDWLQHLRLDWAALNHITQDNCSELKTLFVHSALFAEGLGTIKGTTTCLYLKEGGRPRFYCTRQVSYAMRDQVAKEIDHQVNYKIMVNRKTYYRDIPPAMGRRPTGIFDWRSSIFKTGLEARLSASCPR